MVLTERENEYIIPNNYEDNLVTGGGRSMRNVIEAIIAFGIFVCIFAFLPISLNIKVVLIIATGGPAAFFSFIGIKGCSVTEYLMLVLKFKSKQYDFTRNDIYEKYN